MGPSQDRPLPHTLDFSSTLKNLEKSIWCTFPVLFYGFQKTPTKWKTLTTWWPPGPQAYWSLRIDNFNPYDTSLLPHHQPIRELFTSWSLILRLPSITWPLKMLCWNPLESSGFLSISCPRIPGMPYNKHCTFLHPKQVSVDWLYHSRASRPKFGSITILDTKNDNNLAIFLKIQTVFKLSWLANFSKCSFFKGSKWGS